MNQLLYENSKDFSAKKVTVDQALKILSKNGIRVNKKSAEIILDFLYCIAKTYNKPKGHGSYLEIEPNE